MLVVTAVQHHEQTHIPAGVQLHNHRGGHLNAADSFAWPFTIANFRDPHLPLDRQSAGLEGR